MTKYIATFAGLLSVALLYGARSMPYDTNGYHALCSGVADEAQRSWQEGDISREEAIDIIDGCFAWTERNTD